MEWLGGYATQGVGNIIRRLRGQDIDVTASERANAAMDTARADQQAFQRENPGQALVGGVLGGAAFAPARAAAIPGLLGRIGQSAAIGGAYGAAEGEGVGGRIGSGLLGAGLGAATAGAVEAVPLYARAVSRDIEGLINPPAMAPLSRQEQRVAGTIERAISRDATTPADVLTQMRDLPDGALPFEAAGENLVGLGEVLAQSPGTGRTGLLGAIEQRQGRVNDRITDRLSDAFGADGNYFQTLRQSQQARSQAARQGMEQIGGSSVALSDDAIQAVRSDLSRAAIRDAAANRLASADPLEREAGARLNALVDTALDNPAAAQMTVRDAQDISYALREAASSAYASGNGARGKALSGLGDAIRDSAKSSNKDYAKWLKSYGDASEHIEALQAGRNVFAKATDRNSMSASELADRFSKWSDDAKDNFRRGIGEALLDEVRGKGGVTAMRRLLRSQEFGDRVKVAFPSQTSFDAFMEAAEQEVRMQTRANRVVGNSATDRRAAARADLGEQAGVDPLDLIDLASDVTNPLALGGKALREVLKQIPRRDRSILGDEQLNGLLGRALTDEATMTGLLNRMEAIRAMRANADQRVRSLGLLTAPGVTASGQDRTRGLLTATP